MLDFLRALMEYAFLQHAVLAGILASIACGITGTYVVVKGISYICGGIAHAVLGGMGVAYYLGHDPLLGATLAALISAVLLGLVSLRVSQYEDTVIGALWAIGMAVGIIFISLTPGYRVDLMSFLFGNILMVSGSDLRTMFLLTILILGTVLLFYRQFQALSFDQEHARLRGLRVEVFYILLLCLVALTVVQLIRVVGLILVIALLTLPAAIARLFLNRLGGIMMLATVLGSLFTFVGLGLSYSPDLPSGATIILVAGAGYLLAVLFHQLSTTVSNNDLE